MKKYKYNNTNTTCYKQDAKVILKLKKHFNVRTTNEVINRILFYYINSGEIVEIDKPKVIGVKYYNDIYNRKD